jgi:hypothetical protein
MVRVSLLSEEEIVALYQSDIKIAAISKRAQVSRQAIWGTLKRVGAHEPQHGTRTLICKFCGEQYQVWRGKVSASVYCSIPCCNADKDGIGYYGKRGTIEKYEMDQGMSLRVSRGRARRMMDAKTGEVIHHKDGNPFNNDPDNLMRFPSHAAHMRYHAEQRKMKHK